MKLLDYTKEEMFKEIDGKDISVGIKTPTFCLSFFMKQVQVYDEEILSWNDFLDISNQDVKITKEYETFEIVDEEKEVGITIMIVEENNT